MTAVAAVARPVAVRRGKFDASAGVDSSNAPTERPLFLPMHLQAMAGWFWAALRERVGVKLGVIAIDTLGSIRRHCQIDIFLGEAGVQDMNACLSDAERSLLVFLPSWGDEIAFSLDQLHRRAALL